MDSINPIRFGGVRVPSTLSLSRFASPPTSTLPPLNHLATTHTTEQIKQGLQDLHRLYFPPEPALFHASKKLSISRRRDDVPRPLLHDTFIPDSGYASAEEGEEEEEEEEEGLQDFLLDDTNENNNNNNESDTEIDLLRADPFERSFAIKWLTGFITRSDKWISACDYSESESEERSTILDQAITLLSAFTSVGEETEVALTRTFSFPLTTSSTSSKKKKMKTEIQVELNDAPLSKEDHTSVGLQSWGSSILLAERICLQPSLFSLTMPINNIDPRPLRILELGAGTGMLSIVAAKILQQQQQQQSYYKKPPAPEIIATDYHPEVLDNLSRNVVTNFPKHPAAITVKCLDWEVPQYHEPLDRPFDVILAADVIYHPEHAKWIKQCVEKLLVRPSSPSDSTTTTTITTTTAPLCNRSGGIFWLIIPVRSTGRHEGLDRTVDDLFSAYTHDEHVGAGENTEPRLAIFQKEEVGRQGNVGRADESGYKLFKIGWIN